MDRARPCCLDLRATRRSRVTGLAFQWNGADLLYSTNSGGDWTTETLDDAFWSRTAIAVDSRGDPHLVYRNASGLIHYHGGTTEVIGQGDEPSLAIDAQDHLHVSYTASNGDLKYATNAPGFWKASTIDSSASSGSSQSIAVDPQNKVHVSYRVGSLGSLRYANNVAGIWRSELVDQGALLGHSNSIAAGANGRVVISYRAQNVPTSTFWGAWGESSSNVFIVGGEGIILHHDGASLTAMASGTTSSLYGVWGSSSSNVIAVGSYGTILHYDGQSWGEMSSGTYRSLHGIWGRSSSDVFAVGDDGTILHFDGHAWKAVNSGFDEDLHACEGRTRPACWEADSG